MRGVWQLIHKYHKGDFPNLLKLAAIALVLPVHTTDRERGFCLQNEITNAARNRFKPERLNNLMTLAAEGPHNYEEALVHWKNIKCHSIFSKYSLQSFLH